ncbi:hypothetical protein [Paenibacillus sp. GCM10027626]|uniref:hypothetical protein n=1 Tax=Paenibacillus sp. GCM10027626 TaxID=3273411 RepID=UPI00363AE239
MLTSIIIGCEIGFWLFVLAGLLFRYIFRQQRMGAILLLCTPIVDLILLITTVLDLRNGADATFIHGLAAIYIGVSIAYGHQMIRWADVRFAHRFAGGPPPPEKVKYGAEHARRERKGWLLHLLAFVVGSGLLLGMIALVGDKERTEALLRTITMWLAIVGIDFLWSFSYTLWPKKKGSSSF